MVLCVFSVKLRVINIVTQRTTEDAQRHTEDKLHQLLFDNYLGYDDCHAEFTGNLLWLVGGYDDNKDIPI